MDDILQTEEVERITNLVNYIEELEIYVEKLEQILDKIIEAYGTIPPAKGNKCNCLICTAKKIRNEK